MEDSLTRHGARLQMLLLVSTLASFVSWLAGLGCEATGVGHWLQPRRSARKLYSTMRIGREALVRRWPLEPISRWLDRIRSLPLSVLNQMAFAP